MKPMIHQPQTYLPTYDACYVCGQNHPRGLRVRFYVGEAGKVHADFTPEETQTGYQDMVHGGVISTILDEILGWPIALETHRMCFTGELTVRFLKPMPARQTYLVTAYPGTNKGRYWEGMGNIRDHAGQIYAKAHGKYFFASEEHNTMVAKKLNYQADTLPIFREQHS